MKFAVLWAAISLAAPTGDDAFAKLQKLAGTWSATAENGAVIDATYKLISNDSVLVESYVTASGKETMTVFHRDGPSVIATHYCGQNNQPRLEVDEKSSSARSLLFTFKDATNLRSPAADHLTRLVVKFVDATHFDRIETYSENGKDETTTLHFVKK